MFNRRQLRSISVLALLAFLWGLALPTFAKAGIGDAGKVWAEVCTAQGIKKVELDQGKTHHASADEHCLLCLGGALPGGDIQLLQLPEEFSSVLLLPAASSPRLTAAAFFDAPPRAPPTFPV